jgi:hypothetical protein
MDIKDYQLLKRSEAQLDGLTQSEVSLEQHDVNTNPTKTRPDSILMTCPASHLVFSNQRRLQVINAREALPPSVRAEFDKVVLTSHRAMINTAHLLHLQATQTTTTMIPAVPKKTWLQEKKTHSKTTQRALTGAETAEKAAIQEEKATIKAQAVLQQPRPIQTQLQPPPPLTPQVQIQWTPTPPRLPTLKPTPAIPRPSMNEPPPSTAPPAISEDTRKRGRAGTVNYRELAGLKKRR